VLTGLGALVSALPLAWIAPLVVPETVRTSASDLTYRGTIWRGTLSGLPLFESANYNASLLSQRMNFTTGGRGNYLNGDISKSDAKNINLRVNLTSIPFTDGRLVNLQGDVVALISEMTFDETSCLSAIGNAQTDVLQRNGGAIQWTGPLLTGPISCEEGAVIANLSGKDGQQSVNALLDLAPDGNYRAVVTVRTNRAEADAVLPLFGFTRAGRDFKLTEQGRWR